MEFLTPQLFNALIVANLIVGIGLIFWRLRQDFKHSAPSSPKEDTQPRRR